MEPSKEEDHKWIYEEKYRLQVALSNAEISRRKLDFSGEEEWWDEDVNKKEISHMEPNLNIDEEWWDEDVNKKEISYMEPNLNIDEEWWDDEKASNSLPSMSPPHPAYEDLISRANSQANDISHIRDSENCYPNMQSEAAVSSVGIPKDLRKIGETFLLKDPALANQLFVIQLNLLKAGIICDLFSLVARSKPEWFSPEQVDAPMGDPTTDSCKTTSSKNETSFEEKVDNSILFQNDKENTTSFLCDANAFIPPPKPPPNRITECSSFSSNMTGLTPLLAAESCKNKTEVADRLDCTADSSEQKVSYWDEDKLPARKVPRQPRTMPECYRLYYGHN